MHYVTAFDASHYVFRHWDVVATGVMFGVIGAVFMLVPKPVAAWLSRGGGPLYTRAFGVVFLLFSLVWTTATAKHFYEADGAARAQARQRDCTMIEGRVENFHPMPEAGHEMESFDVAGQHFEYSDFHLSAGFNNSASHGGPIRAGLPVRICHRDGLILILEVAR